MRKRFIGSAWPDGLQHESTIRGIYPDQTDRCSSSRMAPIPWGDHLDLARCVAAIEEDDLREATTAMGRCLFHLQRDLLLETWHVRTEGQPTDQ